MTQPQRMQLSRAPGYRLQAASLALNGLPAIKVDRSTRWGNPFAIGDDGVPDAATAVRLFRKLLERPDLNKHDEFFVFTRDRIILDFSGRNLACWCRLPAAGEPDLCHAAELLHLANEGAA